MNSSNDKSSNLSPSGDSSQAGPGSNDSTRKVAGQTKSEPRPSGMQAGRVDKEGRSEAAISEFHQRKLEDRRQAWQFNYRLAGTTLGIFAVLCALGAASYAYNSKAAVETFKLKAEKAAEQNDYDEVERWWSRYLMMRPDDQLALVEVANAADQVAEQAEQEDLAPAVIKARKRLAHSLSLLDHRTDEETKHDLRRRLIRRYLQLGGYWLAEAEVQVVKHLNADLDDPFAHKALALALVGRVQQDTYLNRALTATTTDDYWEWLSVQPPGITLLRAVELSPNDIDLLSRLLILDRTRPEIFELKKEDESESSESEQRWISSIPIRAAVLRSANEFLKSRNSGHAEFVLYFYGVEGSESVRQAAQQRLLKVADGAAKRLRQYVAKDSQEPAPSEQDSKTQVLVEAKTNESIEGDSVDLELVEQFSPLYWDYQCLLEASRLAAAMGSGQLALDVSDDPATTAEQQVEREAQYLEQARGWYDLLIAAELPEVSPKMRENTFLFAGYGAELQGNVDEAIEIWRQGLVSVNLDNLELRGALAMRLVSTLDPKNDARVAEAQDAISSFEKSVSSETARLVLSTTAEVTERQRRDINRMLDMAKWRLNVASAELKIKLNQGSEQVASAIGNLQSAMDSTADIQRLERANVCRKLAALYAEQEVWDRAGECLSTASDIFPADTSLHALAGDAWTRAGNRLRAAQHWRLAGNSASLDVRVRAAQAEFNDQIRLPPPLRDFGSLRLVVSKLQSEFLAMVQEIDDQKTEGLAENELERIETSLRILKSSIPPRGVLVEQHLSSTEFARFTDELAKEKSENTRIQAYAAERLAAAGLLEEAGHRLSRLEELMGEDSTEYVLVKANIDANNAKPVEAANLLLKHSSNVRPNVAARLARAASNFALGAKDLQLAYQCLRRIPTRYRTPNDLYDLYRQAIQLSKSDGVSEQESAQYTGESETLISELYLAEIAQFQADSVDGEISESGTKNVDDADQSEGSDSAASPQRTVSFNSIQLDATGSKPGTLWRMIVLEQLINELREQGSELTRTDIIEPSTILDRILAERPRWGKAIAMRGFLSALTGNHSQALEQIRSGIQAGDRSLRTRQLMLEQLMELKRYEEAEAEMERMAMAVDFIIDPYAKQDIVSAFNRGELMAAVETARATMKKSKKDATPYIVFSRVASSAVRIDERKAMEGKSKVQMTELERSQLIKEARAAIEQARELSDKNAFALAAAALTLEFRHGTQESVKTVFDEVVSSDLPEHQRLRLEAQVLANNGEYDQAINRLRESYQQVRDVAVQIQLAQLYQQKGQSADLISSLRSAVRLQPENDQLRVELAKAIALHGGDDADWNEVENLLQVQQGDSPANQYVYASLLSSRSDEGSLLKALEITRALSRAGSGASHDAAVLQATVLLKLVGLIETNDKNQSRTKQYLDEAEGIYERLAEVRSPTAADLFQYARFLIIHRSATKMDKVHSIAETIASMPSGMFYSLQLAMLINQNPDAADRSNQWLDDWADVMKAKDTRHTKGSIDSAAGDALTEMGQFEKAVEWYEKAYQQNSAFLVKYVSSLSRVKRYGLAADICDKHFAEYEDVLSAILLVEAMLALQDKSNASKYVETIEKATSLHPKNIALLESVGTWAMQRGRPEDAINLYRRVLDSEPLRIRALNNLAMAYTQVPAMAKQGLPPIEKAIKLTKGDPELLDTKGTVLMKAGQMAEAVRVFDLAIKKRKEPRFYFHKILALLALGREQEAVRIWNALDLEEIDMLGLTLDEREQLDQMKNNFAAASKVSL